MGSQVKFSHKPRNTWISQRNNMLIFTSVNEQKSQKKKICTAKAKIKNEGNTLLLKSPRKNCIFFKMKILLVFLRFVFFRREIQILSQKFALFPSFFASLFFL